MAADRTGKRRSLATNSLFSVLAWIFPILLGFFSTPILVRYLGHEQYGLFAIVLGFISYSFTFGIGKVAGKYVPEYRAAGQSEKVTQVVAATFWLSLTFGVLGSLLLALLAPVIVESLLLIPQESQQAAITALRVAGAIGLASMLSQVFQFVLQGVHRFDNYVTLTNLNGLLLGGGNIVLAINGFGVTSLLIWNLGVVSATGLLFYLRARHLLPSISFVTEIPRSMMTTVARYAGNILLYQVFANALFIFERSWVMRKFGAEGLTYYFVPMLLATYMHGFIASLVQAIFPVVNEIIEDRERITEIYRRANKIILAIVVFVVTNFIVCGALFLELWVSSELATKSYPLLIPHGLTFAVICIGIMAFQLSEVFKFPALNVIMTGSWMALAIPLMIIGAEFWQSEGVAWARFAAALVTFPIIVYTERRFLGQVEWRFWLAVTSRVLFAAAVMAVIQTFILRTMDGTYASLIIAGLTGAAAFAGVLAATGFLTPQDRETVKRSLFRRSGIEPGAIQE
ncbi:MAG TPA: oligosaccharide flippase family protein [Pyrinomonadaceae bacterium]